MYQEITFNQFIELEKNLVGFQLETVKHLIDVENLRIINDSLYDNISKELDLTRINVDVDQNLTITKIWIG